MATQALLRVTQLDAIHLDKEIYNSLVNSFKECSKYLPVSCCLLSNFYLTKKNYVFVAWIYCKVRARNYPINKIVPFEIFSYGKWIDIWTKVVGD